MKVILAAGMVRTGSTWLYNVLRYAYLNAGQRVYGCYASDYVTETQADVHVVKIHNYDDELRRRADLIFTCWRDLRDVAASAVRKGWVTGDAADLVPYLRRILAMQYDAWEPCSDYEAMYPMIADMPLLAVRRLLARLDLDSRFAEPILADLDKIGRIVQPGVNEETQLWPDHITDGGVGTYARTLSQEAIRAVEALMREQEGGSAHPPAVAIPGADEPENHYHRANEPIKHKVSIP